MEQMSLEVAERDFDRLCDEWDVATDKSHMDAEDAQEFETLRAKMVADIARGKIVVSEDGDSVTLNTRGDSEPLVFIVPKGSAWLTMDQHKKNRDMAKFFAYMGAMTGRSSKSFSDVDGRDMKVAMNIVALFMG